MSNLKNPHSFHVFVQALERTLKPGEIVKVADEIADKLRHSGVFQIIDDAEPVAEDAVADATQVAEQAAQVAADIQSDPAAIPSALASDVSHDVETAKAQEPAVEQVADDIEAA